MTRNLAVVGSPISHSKSPQIHGAAYRVLGLDWQYSAIEVTDGRLLQFIETLDASWLGVSVTMPLKFEACRIADSLDEVAELTGIANTLLRTEGGWKGFNTDVFGIQKALQAELEIKSPRVAILGSGATAISTAFAIMLANSEAQITLVARNRKASKELRALLIAKGFNAKVRSISSLRSTVFNSDITVSTLPPKALDEHVTKIAKRWLTKPRGVFLDVAYEPWPSKFATAWQSYSLKTVSGIEMLIHQAIAQVRIFTGGDPAKDLPNERAVELAMSDSQGLI